MWRKDESAYDDANSTSDRSCSPLPPLIMERVPNQHDHSQKFYHNLECKMKKLYRRIFIDESSSVEDLMVDKDHEDEQEDENVDKTNGLKTLKSTTEIIKNPHYGSQLHESRRHLCCASHSTIAANVHAQSGQHLSADDPNVLGSILKFSPILVEKKVGENCDSISNKGENSGSNQTYNTILNADLSISSNAANQSVEVMRRQQPTSSCFGSLPKDFTDVNSSYSEEDLKKYMFDEKRNHNKSTEKEIGMIRTEETKKVNKHRKSESLVRKNLPDFAIYAELKKLPKYGLIGKRLSFGSKSNGAENSGSDQTHNTISKEVLSISSNASNQSVEVIRRQQPTSLCFGSLPMDFDATSSKLSMTYNKVDLKRKISEENRDHKSSEIEICEESRDTTRTHSFNYEMGEGMHLKSSEKSSNFDTSKRSKLFESNTQLLDASTDDDETITLSPILQSRSTLFKKNLPVPDKYAELNNFPKFVGKRLRCGSKSNGADNSDSNQTDFMKSKADSSISSDTEKCIEARKRRKISSEQLSETVTSKNLNGNAAIQTSRNRENTVSWDLLKKNFFVGTPKIFKF